MKNVKILYLLLLLPLLSFGQKDFTLDKQAHFLAGSTISAVTYSLVLKKTNNQKKAFLYSLVTPLIIGLGKEVYDSQRRNGFNSKDLAYTVTGGISASFVIQIF